MKVLYYINLIPEKLGAFELMLIALGDVFRRQDDELVLVFAAEPVEELSARFRQAGLRWHILEGWSDGEGIEHAWAYCRPAIHILKQERPDVATVHFGNELPALVSRLLAPWCGVRGQQWVWQQHQQIKDPGFLGRVFSRIRILSLRFERFIAVYTGGKTSMMMRGIPGYRITVNHNAIQDQSAERTKGWLRAELGVPADSVLIVTTGWLVARKRIDFIIRGFTELAETARDKSVLLIIGDGPERGRLEASASELGVSARVRFLGLRQDVREILHVSDVLVHSSTAETCTYAITESMAVGIPAVVTEAGAAHEQISDGVSGWVVARDDQADFTRRLQELADSPDQRKRFGLEARKRFEDMFRLEVSAQAFHAFYKMSPGQTERPVTEQSDSR